MLNWKCFEVFSNAQLIVNASQTGVEGEVQAAEGTLGGYLELYRWIFTRPTQYWCIFTRPTQHWCIFTRLTQHWCIFTRLTQHWWIFTLTLVYFHSAHSTLPGVLSLSLNPPPDHCCPDPHGHHCHHQPVFGGGECDAPTKNLPHGRLGKCCEGCRKGDNN